jgi:hypothetical protein
MPTGAAGTSKRTFEKVPRSLVSRDIIQAGPLRMRDERMMKRWRKP